MPTSEFGLSSHGGPDWQAAAQVYVSPKPDLVHRLDAPQPGVRLPLHEACVQCGAGAARFDARSKWVTSGSVQKLWAAIFSSWEVAERAIPVGKCLDTIVETILNYCTDRQGEISKDHSSAKDWQRFHNGSNFRANVADLCADWRAADA